MNNDVFRGTTPTWKITLPFPTASIDKIYLYVSQDKKLLFTKENDDMEFDTYAVIVTLTQEDTLKIDDEKVLDGQIRVKYTSGVVGASYPFHFDAIGILKGGVI